MLNAHLIVRKNDLKNFVGKLLSISSKFNPWHKYCNIITRNASKLMLKNLKDMRKEGYYPDVIIMEWTEIVLQIDEIKKIFPKTKFVASEHDVVYLGKRRKAEYETRKLFIWYKEIQARNVYIRETKALDKRDLIFTHNSKDKALLQKAGLCSNKIAVISPYFHQSKLNYKRKCKDVVFFGNMSRDENITAVKWFIDNVMLRLADIPCRFVVIGGEV